MRSFLPAKVEEGIKTVRAVKALLGFSVAALHLSVVPGRIGADEPNSQLSDRCLKEGFQIALAARKAIGERKAVIGLNTLDGNAFAGKLPGDLAWKVRGGKGALFLVSAWNPVAGIPVNGGVPIQLSLRACNTASGYDLHVDLNALAGILHLLVGLLLLCLCRPPFPSHHPP